MTRKDYVAIAGALKCAVEYARTADSHNYGGTYPGAENGEAELAGIMEAADRIARVMRDDNPRFDREHFLAVVRGERELQSRLSTRGKGRAKP